MTALTNVQFYWLRNKQFDSVFIALPLILGVTVLGLCTLDPSLFPYLLLADLWLLGYHHVISTYTRIAFDWTSAKKHYFLVFILPFLMLGATVGLYKWLGSWVIASVYLYWQWFHYVRQSYGISRYYLSRGGKDTPPSLYHPIHTLALYALPVTGILYRSWQAPESFLMMDLKVIPVASGIVMAAFSASIVLIAWQVKEWVRLSRSHQLHGSYVTFLLTHHLVFLLGYIVVKDINTGWLCVNIWHNLQYILFVWMQNNQTYRAGIHPDHKLISRLSQDGKIAYYLAFCMLLTFGLYILFSVVGQAVEVSTTVTGMLIVFMAVNFHHYVVDATIWRRKKSKKPA